LSSDWQLHKVQNYFFKNEKGIAYIAGTTQAIDIINGGVKANALPELAYATVNHRISTDRYG
jgi:Gly-Xaa carboxypeptidase